MTLLDMIEKQWKDGLDKWGQDVNAAFFPAVDAYWENKKNRRLER